MISVLLEQGDKFCKVGETVNIQLSAVAEKVEIGCVVTVKSGILIVGEQMVAGRPVQVDGFGIVADNSGNAEFILHAVDSGESRFICGGTGKGRRVNARFFENAGIVGKTDCFNGVGESDCSILIDIGGVGIGSPCLIAHIGAQS